MYGFAPSLADHILMLFMGVIIPLFAVFRSQPSMKKVEFTTQIKIGMYWGNSVMLWLGVLAIVIVWWWNDRPWDLLGFAFPKLEDPWWWWLTIIFVVAYFLDVLLDMGTLKSRERTRKQWLKNLPFLPATGLELRHFMVLAISAAVCEEIIFRGYFINYLLNYTGLTEVGLFNAVIFPGLVFSLSHIYQGWKAVLKIIAMAVIFGYLLLKTESLFLLILLHFLVDFLGGIFAKFLLKESK